MGVFSFMELFMLNDKDYTQHIVVPSYKVQREEVVKTWEDALYETHMNLLRFKIKGNFTMYFDDIDEYTEFLDTLENLRGTDNYIIAKVYDNKTHSQKESKFKIDLSLQNDLPYYGVKSHGGFQVQIEEK